jgi:hypothetical protein
VRIEPAAAARRLRALTLAVSHPALIADEPLSPAEIVSLLLDGIRARPDRRNVPGADVAGTDLPGTDVPAAAPC